jgi:YHS domain-containing protein
MRRIFLILLVVGFGIGLNQLSFAMRCHQKDGEHQQILAADSNQAEPKVVSQPSLNKAENVGNKICPVSGEKINEKMKATYEYKGKIYNFCCAMCIDEFKKDPEKYIKKVEEELKAKSSQATEENKTMHESEMPMPMHQGHHH